MFRWFKCIGCNISGKLKINIRELNKMKKKIENIVYDDITNYGITIIGGKMYLVKDCKKMKLESLIIKEKKEVN